MSSELAAVPVASPELIESLRRVVADQMAHDHASAAGPGDLYCLNLTSYMGERMGPVLQLLARETTRADAAEAELFRVRSQLASRL